MNGSSVADDVLSAVGVDGAWCNLQATVPVRFVTTSTASLKGTWTVTPVLHDNCTAIRNMSVFTGKPDLEEVRAALGSTKSGKGFSSLREHLDDLMELCLPEPTNKMFSDHNACVARRNHVPLEERSKVQHMVKRLRRDEVPCRVDGEMGKYIKGMYRIRTELPLWAAVSHLDVCISCDSDHSLTFLPDQQHVHRTALGHALANADVIAVCPRGWMSASECMRNAVGSVLYERICTSNRILPVMCLFGATDTSSIRPGLAELGTAPRITARIEHISRCASVIHKDDIAQKLQWLCQMAEGHRGMIAGFTKEGVSADINDLNMLYRDSSIFDQVYKFVTWCQTYVGDNLQDHVARLAFTLVEGIHTSLLAYIKCRVVGGGCCHDAVIVGDDIALQARIRGAVESCLDKLLVVVKYQRDPDVSVVAEAICSLLGGTYGCVHLKAIYKPLGYPGTADRPCAPAVVTVPRFASFHKASTSHLSECKAGPDAAAAEGIVTARGDYGASWLGDTSQYYGRLDHVSTAAEVAIFPVGCEKLAPHASFVMAATAPSQAMSKPHVVASSAADVSRFCADFDVPAWWYLPETLTPMYRLQASNNYAECSVADALISVQRVLAGIELKYMCDTQASIRLLRGSCDVDVAPRLAELVEKMADAQNMTELTCMVRSLGLYGYIRSRSHPYAQWFAFGGLKIKTVYDETCDFGLYMSHCDSSANLVVWDDVTL